MIAMLLPLLLQFAPMIVSGVETLFGHGNGAQKKQAAVNMMGDAANALATAKGFPGLQANSDLMTLISDVLEATVKYMNASGQFSHGGTQ